MFIRSKFISVNETHVNNGKLWTFSINTKRFTATHTDTTKKNNGNKMNFISLLKTLKNLKEKNQTIIRNSDLY